MSVAETQAALARLYADGAFRAWFEHAPADALAKYDLTDSERAAIESVDRKMLAMFADALRGKWRGRIVPAFPLSAAVCGDKVNDYFDRYYDLHPAQPGMSSTEQIIAFGRFLAETIAVDRSLPAYAADLCRYERTITQARSISLDDDDLLLLAALATAETPAVPDGERLLDEAMPRLAPGVWVLRFGYDIPHIAAVISDTGEPPVLTESDERATHVVLKAGQGMQPSPFKVNAAAATLLSECDGTKSVAEIIHAIEAKLTGHPVTVDAVKSTLLGFRQSGFIRFELGTDFSERQLQGSASHA
jgi:hypothetical protein